VLHFPNLFRRFGGTPSQFLNKLMERVLGLITFSPIIAFLQKTYPRSRYVQNNFTFDPWIDLLADIYSNSNSTGDAWVLVTLPEPCLIPQELVNFPTPLEKYKQML
jgi:hypothetical protein